MVLCISAAVGSLGQGVGYLLSPIACYLFERFGFRKTVLFSALIGVVGLIGSAASPVLPLLYFTYGVLASIGLAFIHNASVVVVLKNFVKWRSLSSGIQQSAFGIGMLFITQISRPIADRFEWRWTFGIWAALVATILLMGLLFDGNESRAIDIQSEIPDTNWQFELMPTLKNRLLLLYSCSFALSFMAFYVPHIFLVSKPHRKPTKPKRNINLVGQSTIGHVYLLITSFP